jgi:hypothetical protein
VFRLLLDPAGDDMTQQHIVSADDARKMFHACMYPHDAEHADVGPPGAPCPYPPLFTFLAVDEKILCGECGGRGGIPSPWTPDDFDAEQSRCPGCEGSGLATEVEIVSEVECSWTQPCCDDCEGTDEGHQPTVHGILTVGPPWPVFGLNTPPFLTDWVEIRDDGVFHFRLPGVQGGLDVTDITDRFGDHVDDLKPGMFVYAVTPREKP